MKTRNIPKSIPVGSGVGGLVYDPVERLAQLSQQYNSSPAFFSGTGETGLGRHDERGYRQMLQDQTEYKQLGNLITGQEAPDIQYGGATSSMEPLDRATGENAAETFGLPASVSHAALKSLKKATQPPDMGAGYETHDQFMKRYGR